jgi:hypothetical protein
MVEVARGQENESTDMDEASGGFDRRRCSERGATRKLEEGDCTEPVGERWLGHMDWDDGDLPVANTAITCGRLAMGHAGRCDWVGEWGA